MAIYSKMCFRPHPSPARYVTVFPQKGQEGGDGFDCNLRLCPSQNNSSNNLCPPPRSVVMNTLRHADTGAYIYTRSKMVRGDNGLKKTGPRSRSGRHKSYLSVFGGCYSDAAFSPPQPPLPPSSSSLSSPLDFLPCVCDGWAALSYE